MYSKIITGLKEVEEIKSITILASTMQLFRLAKSNLLIWILHVRKQKT